jgi:hypothetical protein
VEAVRGAEAVNSSRAAARRVGSVSSSRARAASAVAIVSVASWARVPRAASRICGEWPGVSRSQIWTYGWIVGTTTETFH